MLPRRLSLLEKIVTRHLFRQHLSLSLSLRFMKCLFSFEKRIFKVDVYTKRYRRPRSNSVSRNIYFYRDPSCAKWIKRRLILDGAYLRKLEEFVVFVELSRHDSKSRREEKLDQPESTSNYFAADWNPCGVENRAQLRDTRCDRLGTLGGGLIGTRIRRVRE